MNYLVSLRTVFFSPCVLLELDLQFHQPCDILVWSSISPTAFSSLRRVGVPLWKVFQVVNVTIIVATLHKRYEISQPRVVPVS